jgi:Glyoxalase-like domain
VAVDDLDTAAATLLADHGLASVPGGRHPGHGTANRIVPMAGAYLELMAVADPEEAGGSILGRFVIAVVEAGGGPMAVCLRTGDIGLVSARLGLEPMAMERKRPDGTKLKWLLAGLDRALGPDRLPFFIEWQVAPGQHPAETVIRHRGGPASLDGVILRGDAATVAEWIGANVPSLHVLPGEPGVAAIHLTVGGTEVVIAS